ncbi:discoidin domain-containing protein [Pleionea sediminis]|uniref:discoidin domain-containing protein n=1 Tax=Pleionea sediminis TaxID=2569479 RepID=UPI0011868E8F|nr:discoidin domain-containing protein [Pleionea sediminis]
MNIKQLFALSVGALLSTSLLAVNKLDITDEVVTKMDLQSADDVTVIEQVPTKEFTTSGNIASQGYATAQSTFPGYSASNINDGDRNTTVGGSYSWANGHTYAPDGRLPNWVQLAYRTERTFSKVVLYTSRGYELKDYDIQIRSGRNWITVVRQRGNTNVSRVHTFRPTSGNVIRVMALRGPDNQYIYGRVNELEVYESAVNLARKARASAQSSFPGYSPAKVNDGDKNVRVGGAYSWANGHKYTPDGRLPQWLQLDFGRYERISKVVLYTSLGYEIKDYDIQVWNGRSWNTVVTQRGNTSVRRTHTFAPAIGSKLRVIGRRGPDNQYIYVRVNELEVY